MRIQLIAALALVTLTASILQAKACGFEDPDGVRIQKAVLTQVYPNAIYVQGAADEALRKGVLSPRHFTRPGALFAFQRTVSNLRRFADGLAEGAMSKPPQFSLVLLGPVLWAHFSPSAEGMTAEMHVQDPLPNSVVLVSDVPVMAALISGDLSGAQADGLGLLRFYGAPVEVSALRNAIVQAFPTGRLQ